MLKVLIVDDQSYNRTVLKHILQNHNFYCSEAENGQVAVELIEKDQSISLVLMDIDMPVLGGIAAAREIKSRFSSRFIPIVFVTAMDDDDTMAECLEAGGDDFVPKPVHESALVAKVAAHMRTAALYSELQSTNRDLSYHKQLVDREHAIIDHVFRNGRRRFSAQCHNLKCNVSPVSMFNGDLLLSAPSTAGGLYVLLGDFTGHGLAAAIGSLPVSDIFYAMARKQTSVSEMTQEMNRKLGEMLPDNMFFCCLLMEISATGERLTYWSGGINDVLLIGEDGGIMSRLTAQHMPISILDEDEFDSSTDIVTLTPGTRLLAYTDGVIESVNPFGEMFGEERLAELFEYPSDNYMEIVLDALREFTAGEKQTDDISILELDCSPLQFENSEPAQANLENASLPWSLHFELGHQELKQKGIIMSVVRQLENFDALKSHLDTLYTILSELFNNALDHGILELDSAMKADPEGFETYYEQRGIRLAALEHGSIKLKLNYSRQSNPTLSIQCHNSGAGFDVETMSNDGENWELASGRGMMLLRSLCNRIEYSDSGRCVTATYPLYQ